jgi:EAL domain-containing protein (putative c-di-GMP-specific phosphodiesterase class I)
MQDLWEVMEAMGTETANKVARQLADNINSTVDREHHLYRFSTSELMLLFLAESHKDVDDVASAVRRAGEYESEIDGIPIRVQLVVGSYLAERSISEPDVIVNRARKGLFAAINSNVFYRAYEPSIDQQTVERIRLISSVRRGLSDNEFVLFYQPKICLTTGRHVGGEGLLRWLKEDGSIVFPGLFMPKLENTTLIDPVTRFVVDKACNDINAQQLSPISINFSTKNLMDNELVQNLSRSVQALGVEPQMLEIEITEGALIRNPAHAKVAIQSLRDQGFSVSLDDFGTGYSSFEYLSQLPLSGLKIDRAFVSGLEQSAHARAVLKSMVDVAHALNLKITIEGIETAAQHQIVSELGAHQAQGFYYSKAIPVSEYANWHWEGDGPAESDRGVVSNSGQ